MSDSQNSNKNDPVTTDEVANRKDVEAPSKSYYYDDSTGYERYDGEDDQKEAGTDDRELHRTEG